MAFERATRIRFEETPARFAGGRFSRADEAAGIHVPLERTPLLSDTAAPSEPVRSEPRNQSAALQKAAKPEAKPRLAKGETQKDDTEKPSWLSRFLSPILSPVIRNPWLPWRKPKTPEAQEAMEKEHEALLSQTGKSVALVGAVDVIMFFVSHGTIPPVKFLSAVAMLVSTMYFPSFKKKKQKTGVIESKTFINERFEKNAFGHAWFPWAWGKPRTPEKQAKMQEQHKEYVMSMASATPILFLTALIFPQLTAARIAWGLGTIALINAFASLKENPPKVFKSEKIENFFFGRALMFRKPQTPEAQKKTNAETKKLALSTFIVSASAGLARWVGVIPMTPWAWFAPAFPALALVAQRLFKILAKPYSIAEARAPEKKSGRKGKEGPGRFLKNTLFNMNAWENVIFGRALMFRKSQTPEAQARDVRETKRTALLTIITALPAYAAYALGAISLSAVYAIPAAVLAAFVGIPLVFKHIVVPSVKAAFKMFGVDLDAIIAQKRKDAQKQQQTAAQSKPKAAPQEKPAATS